MFKSLVCGSNFGEEEGDDKPQVPRRRRKRVFSIRRKDRTVENPYSSYGLDKLASLVADLREKREKISSKNRGMVLVRSVHTSRDASVPVVVKGTSRNNREEAEGGDSVSDKHVILTDRSTSSEESSRATGEGKEAKTPVDGSKKASFMSGEAEPGSYAAAAAAVVILILIMLAFFGRPVVILWSSMAWYIVPALRGTRSKSPNPTGTVAKQIYDEKPDAPRNPCRKPLSCSSSFTSRINISQLPLKDLML